MEIIFILIVFMILFTLPFIISFRYFKNNKGNILFINQNKVKNPRYFALSFSKLIENNIDKIHNNKIKLSKEEEFIDSNELKNMKDEVKSIVICRETGKELIPYNVKYFYKEIYSTEDINFSQKTELRALYSKKRIILGEGTTIIRWVDAEISIAVYDNCDLGISITSAGNISIGRNCKFRRIYAPKIAFGQYPGKIKLVKDREAKIYNMKVQNDIKKNIKYITDDMISEEGVVDFSVISSDNINITENIIVRGDIRSHKGVRICDKSVVLGNVFAEKNIIIGKDAVVLGNVFSMAKIYMEEDSVVGKEGMISSVIAKDGIKIEKNCFVFGYVGCEKGGIVAETKEKIEEELIENKYNYLEEIEKEKVIKFERASDFENINQQGFRYNKSLEEIFIPEGVSYIQKSLFYKCKNLKYVHIPNNIKNINDYAFAECTNLESIDLLKMRQLKTIGVSSFENCKELKEIVFPASLVSIGGAAFSGCENLKKIMFEENSNLEIIDSHAFKGCKKLEEIILGNNIKNIGLSAFKDCQSLKKISLHVSCINEVGIKELKELNIEIIFRSEVDNDEIDLEGITNED